ncbi:MAG: S1C family serine protease [Pirellulaceae bacterium]|nr:S1C family serine protease [Pirellulaceae bacterium]
MKLTLKTSALLLAGFLLLVDARSFSQEPAGSDQKSSTPETESAKAQSDEEKPEVKKPEENKKTGNWYIRQSPQMLKMFEPIAGSAKNSTVKVLSNVSSSKTAKEGQVALGTVIDSKGLILTKASEIIGKSKSLKIEVNGKKVPAKIFGIHENSDLAMLKIEPAGLGIQPIQWESQTPEVGYFLTSPNSEGKPVGIGILSVGSRRNLRGFLGVNLENVNEKKGSRVTNVVPKSPAEQAGVVKSDVITHVNGKLVENTQDLINKVQEYLPGQIVKIKLSRKDKQIDLDIKLGSLSALGGPSPRLNPQETIAGNKLSTRRNGFEQVVQHDTVLKPDQMGGPILDLNGRALGVNIAKNGRVSTFALPLTVLEPAIAELRSGKLDPAIVNKPRIDELNTMIAAQEKEIEEKGIRKAAEESQKLTEEASKAFDAAAAEYDKHLKQMEEALSKKLKADEKHKKIHLDGRNARRALRDAEKAVEKLKSEKQSLEDTFK